MMELSQDEQMNIEGGGFWENLGYVYGAVAGGFSTCAFPVGMLDTASYQGGGHICTSR